MSDQREMLISFCVVCGGKLVRRHPSYAWKHEVARADFHRAQAVDDE